MNERKMNYMIQKARSHFLLKRKKQKEYMSNKNNK